MKTKIILSVLALAVMVSAYSQKSAIELTFTAVDNASHVRLDSIKVMNRTQGDSAMLYWPDTTLTYEITPGDLLLYIGYAMGYPVGVRSISNRAAQFKLFQSYPNPARDQTVISMSLPFKGSLNITVADIRGRVALNFDREFQEGTHSFRFHPGDARVYILTARWNGITQGIKILTEGPITGKTCRLEYTGIENRNPALKQSLAATDLVVRESGMLDTPGTNKTYSFQFATNIPCPGTPTVTYGGQVYNTVQINSQCWLKENLNIGTMILGSREMTDNDTIEKYCFNNDPDSCSKYGGLYQWNEMMQYDTVSGSQGICPQGWHIPSDEEWKILEGSVDSLYGIGDPEWDIDWDRRGYNAAKNLKSITGWYDGGNGTDLYGFSGLPAGFRKTDGIFDYLIIHGDWWTSTQYDASDSRDRYFYYGSPESCRYYLPKENGFSVRCLQNY